MQTPDDVDFRIMSTFVEFYSIFLGFVNYKSYQDIGLIYPPKLSISQDQSDKADKLDAGDLDDEYLASLNCDFVKLDESSIDEPARDDFPVVSVNSFASISLLSSSALF